MSYSRRRSSAGLVAMLVLCCCGGGDLAAAVFQYREMVPAKKGERPVFCWIPPQAERINGVLMSGQTLAERDMSKDPVIRAACAEAGLAIVFAQVGLRGLDVQAVLDRFAAQSGYQELARAPLFFVGHSAGGPQAKQRAIEFKERCFGLMQFRGGVPNAGQDPTSQPGVGPGVPSLIMVGQFDEFGGAMRTETGEEPAWERGRDALIRYRSAAADNLGSMHVEAGAGHFPWSDRCAAYLALYVKKAAAARIPKDWPIDTAEPVQCLPVDPTSGWLTDLRLGEEGAHPAAAYADYAGDKGAAAWHFDEELALATEATHRGLKVKGDQFIKWQDPYWVDAGVRYFFTKITWVDDGMTFQVHPVYSDQYPPLPKGGQGPRWAKAGQPCTHSDAPITVRGISGPLVAVADDKLAIRFDNLTPYNQRVRGTFLASSVGDDRHRYSECAGMLPRGFKGPNKGSDQTITFPELADLPATAEPVSLAATSDAGLPVRYYVAVGPAAVVDGKLAIRDLPKRASYPITVEVVAWQYGSFLEPKAKPAAPVTRTVQILAP